MKAIESKGLKMQEYMKTVHRLVRLIKAKQLPHWLYDQEEGHVDISKLTRVVVNPATPMTFVKEQITDFKPTLFYFLIDGKESDDLYRFICDFCLGLEKAGAVYSEIFKVKLYKKKARALNFDRDLIKSSLFSEEDLKKIRFKRKILINFTNKKVNINQSKLFHLLEIFDIKEAEEILNKIYAIFDKD